MITIWHNPRCSKSRQALQLLQDRGYEFEIFRYLDTPPTDDQLLTVLSQLKITPNELVRRGESAFKLLSEDQRNSDERLLEAMTTNPILIERPIVIGPNGAIIGRPPESILTVI